MMQYDGQVCDMIFLVFANKISAAIFCSQHFGWQSKKNLDKVVPVQGLALSKGNG
jgi:hypothetical protein